jgi:hypothetical protein
MSEAPVEPPEQPAERPPGKPDFVRRAFLDNEEVLGARWWNESFQAFHAQATMGRRKLLGLVPWMVGGGIGAAMLGFAFLKRPEGDDGDAAMALDTIDLQRREGWNAGHPDKALAPFSDLVRDINGRADWLGRMRELVTLLAPDPHLARFAVPTLFQALAEPANQSLLQMMRPFYPPDADPVFERGEALRKLHQQPDAPRDLAVFCDLPGPLSVAFAAAMAARFCPVFTFDNWPHPLGVVPSHMTLGACLYYLPLFRDSAQTRPRPAPPLFVLDANRLNPYRDQPDQFDNRYVAPVPSASALTAAGIKRILYIRPDAASLTELDDLNADFVSWEQAGIPVRAVPLSDFSQAETAATPAAATSASHLFFWGGHSHHHPFFWRSYGFGAGPAPARRPPRTAPPPPRLSEAPAYRPSFRPTLFSSRTIGGAPGVGKQKPSGFGRVSVRMNAGRVTAIGSSARRRSGSFGRSRSSYSG